VKGKEIGQNRLARLSVEMLHVEENKGERENWRREMIAGRNKRAVG
jgi:hypothetical protein